MISRISYRIIVTADTITKHNAATATCNSVQPGAKTVSGTVRRVSSLNNTPGHDERMRRTSVSLPLFINARRRWISDRSRVAGCSRSLPRREQQQHHECLALIARRRRPVADRHVREVDQCCCRRYFKSPAGIVVGGMTFLLKFGDEARKRLDIGAEPAPGQEVPIFPRQGRARNQHANAIEGTMIDTAIDQGIVWGGASASACHLIRGGDQDRVENRVIGRRNSPPEIGLTMWSASCPHQQRIGLIQQMLRIQDRHWRRVLPEWRS